MAPLFGVLVLAALAAWALKGSFDRTGMTPFLRLCGGAVWRFFQPLSFLRPNEGAKFLDGFGGWRLANAGNRGLVVDGDRSRIPEDASYRHLILVAPTGQGKTSRYIIPNVLQLENCSMVITDPSGEIWEQTSGSLRERGFDVKVLDLADPSRSVGYNPMAKVRSAAQAADLARVLIESSKGSKGNDAGFWNQGAEQMIDVLIQTLLAVDYRKANPEHGNLHNVLYLLQNFGMDGRDIDRFVFRNGEKGAYRSWVGLMAGSEKVTQSYASSALNALRMLAIPELASVLSRDELDFQSLRERKTALFIVVPSHKVESYSFVLNMLHTQAFSAWIEPGARREGLPIHVLADEFGHSAIPDFSSIITTIRKYRVSVSMVLQSISQLQERYGPNAARTILEGGVGSRLIYGGADVGTTAWVESMAGKTRYREYDERGPKSSKEESLINADRVRTLGDDQAILLFANKEPLLLKTTPFFRNRRLKAMVGKEPWNPVRGARTPELQFVDMAPYRR